MDGSPVLARGYRFPTDIHLSLWGTNFTPGGVVLERFGKDLYVVQMNTTGDVKVGRSKNVERRMKQLQTGSPHRLRLILHSPGEGHREKEVHRRMARGRTRWDGEWFEEDSLAELPDDLYEKLLHIEDQDWWKGEADTKKALPAEPPKPHWFDALYEQGFWGNE